MSGYNKVILMGNLTREPEMRVTPSGMPICKFSIAVNRRFTDREGSRREETVYVDIDSFGRQAETISRYMAKGRPILVEGRLKLDQWETREGEKRSKLGVALENFTFLPGGGGEEAGAPQEREREDAAEPLARAPRQAAFPGKQMHDPDADEDVPF